MYLIRLYVIGQTAKAEKAIDDLTGILDDEIKSQDEYSLEVIDVLENPELAEDDKILVTPTAIKILPQPSVRVVGDFSDKARVLIGLNIQAAMGKR